MTPLRLKPRAASKSVLLVSSESVELLVHSSANDARHVRREVRGKKADDIAAAALEAARDLGVTREPCVVALAGSVLEHRTLTLPPRARTELRRVLQRKAAGLLECDPREVTYAALPASSGDSAGDADTAEQRWHVFAVRQTFLVELLKSLRKARLRVSRVECAVLARMSRAHEARGSSEGACIVVDIDRTQVNVGLITQDALLMLNRIAGDFEALPTMAVTVIQELRTFDAYWRKLSRGHAIDQVVVLGLDFERARLLATAVATTLPGTKVLTLPDEAMARSLAASTLRAGRFASLDACAAEGPLNLDFKVRLPVRHAYLLSLVGSLVLIAGGVGTVAHERLSVELDETLERTRRLDRMASDLEANHAHNAAVAAALTRLELETRRLVEAGRFGVPLERTVEACESALRGRGRLLTLNAHRDGSEGDLALGGEVDSDPLRTARLLLEIELALQREPTFEAETVVARLPSFSKAGEQSEAAKSLAFELEARFAEDAP